MSRTPVLAAAAGGHHTSAADWLVRIVLTLAVLAMLSGLYWLMWRGWKNRAARQADLLPVPMTVVPEEVAETGGTAGFGAPVEGVYASTTTANDWLDRIAVHGLGVRGSARVRVGPPGVFFAREAAPDLFIPASDLVGAQLAPGIAGKVTGAEGVVLVTWRLGGRTLDTGFHPRSREDREPLVRALGELVTAEGGAV
jgi:hypothetical protein